MTKQLRVAMIGHGFMGAAHSQAWRTAHRFFDLPATPVMAVVVGTDAARTAESAQRWGWQDSSTDWRQVVAREDIDVVDIVTVGDTHAEIALAALAAGKHVLCEKPLARTVAEAEQMTAAAHQAADRGQVAMVGFSYRRVPAATFARDLVAAGRLGQIHQVRAAYRQDWLSDPDGPMTWRLEKDRAGSGSLGDIGAHAIDMAEFMTGLQLTRVSGVLDTIVTERPLMTEGVGLGGKASTTERGRVTVDDVAIFTGRFEAPSGQFAALGSFEATRYATGRKNGFTIELSGTKGAIFFDMERPNELDFYDATLPENELGFRTIFVTGPEHPYAHWWPTGHMLGYEHAFSHQVVDLVTAISTGEPAHPTFAEGLHVQQVLAAVERSSQDDSRWVSIG